MKTQHVSVLFSGLLPLKSPQKNALAFAATTTISAARRVVAGFLLQLITLNPKALNPKTLNPKP